MIFESADQKFKFRDIISIILLIINNRLIGFFANRQTHTEKERQKREMFEVSRNKRHFTYSF